MEEYFEQLASTAPTPGGGSAAMVVAATAAALLAMVSRIRAATPLVLRADLLRAELLQQRERDEAAYSNVVAAQDEEAKQRALAEAAAEPLEGARQSLETLRLASDALEIAGRQLVSDVGCAAEFAHAALLACGYNVRVNHRFMHDLQTVATQGAQLDRYEREAAALIAALRKAVEERLRD